MPYKHKVGGSNPSSTTMRTKAPAMGLLLCRNGHRDLNPARVQQPCGLLKPERRDSGSARAEFAKRIPNPSSTTMKKKSPDNGAFTLSLTRRSYSSEAFFFTTRFTTFLGASSASAACSFDSETSTSLVSSAASAVSSTAPSAAWRKSSTA